MGGSTDRVAVSPKELATTGQSIITTADTMHTNIEELPGHYELTAADNPTFQTTLASQNCYASWMGTLESVGTRIAVAGDNIKVSAGTYHEVEHRNHKLLGGR